MEEVEGLPYNTAMSSNLAKIRLKGQATDTTGKSEPTLADRLRQNELLRYLEDHVFHELLRDSRTLKFGKGKLEFQSF
jgi:hypothetical protein